MFIYLFFLKIWKWFEPSLGADQHNHNTVHFKSPLCNTFNLYKWKWIEMHGSWILLLQTPINKNQLNTHKTDSSFGDIFLVCPVKSSSQILFSCFFLYSIFKQCCRISFHSYLTLDCYQLQGLSSLSGTGLIADDHSY